MSTSHDDLSPGEGKVLADQHIALFNDQGKILAFSSACTHIGCDVEWNGEDKTWECPCHGSRFAPDGRVLRGPATRPLAPVDVPK